MLNTSTRTTSLVTPLGQGPLLTVHRNSLMPIGMALTVVVGLLASAKVPPPLTTVHVPVAGKVTALPARVTRFGAVGTQMLWSGPALALALSGSNRRMVTSSLLVPHGPLFTVQRNTLAPMPRPVTDAPGLFGSTMAPAPLTKVHVPTAGAFTALPARLLPVLPHSC